MRFDLTPEIIDQIIFAMENQDTRFVFDSEKRTVVEAYSVVELEENGAEEGFDVGRHLDIPEWSSADGFQLMERFVATLRNPLARERLRAALSGGKGVFRNFKNALKEHEEVERLWFSFKDREMRSKVIDWYGDLCDLWGWERVGPEPDEQEETEELVLSDFEFEVEGPRGLDLVRAYDREAWEEAMATLPSPIIATLYRRARSDIDPGAENSLVVSARTPGGEFAGFVWGIHERGEQGTGGLEKPPAWMRIAQLYVTREFRGLGIAKSLIDHVCRISYGRGLEKIIIDLAGTGEVLLASLEEEGFSVFSRGLILNVEEWGRDNGSP